MCPMWPMWPAAVAISMALRFGVALQQQVVVVVSLSWALERLGWWDLWQRNFSNATAPRVPGRVRNGMWQPVATCGNARKLGNCHLISHDCQFLEKKLEGQKADES